MNYSLKLGVCGEIESETKPVFAEILAEPFNYKHFKLLSVKKS